MKLIKIKRKLIAIISAIAMFFTTTPPPEAFAQAINEGDASVVYEYSEVEVYGFRKTWIRNSIELS